MVQLRAYPPEQEEITLSPRIEELKAAITNEQSPHVAQMDVAGRLQVAIKRIEMRDELISLLYAECVKLRLAIAGEIRL